VISLEVERELAMPFDGGGDGVVEGGAGERVGVLVRMEQPLV